MTPPYPDPQPIIDHCQYLLVMGTKWAEAGDHPTQGCNCYGFVRYVFRLIDVTLPDEPEAAEPLFVRFEGIPQPFDVLLFHSDLLRGGRGVGLVRPHLGVLLHPPRGYHCAQLTQGLARFSLFDSVWRHVKRTQLRYRPFALFEGE
jgi:hypothetical protein